MSSRESKHVWSSQIGAYKEELATLTRTLSQLQKAYQVKEDIRSFQSDVLFKCKEQLQGKDHSQLESNYHRIIELIKVLNMNNMPTASWESLASIFKELQRLHAVDSTSHKLTQQIDRMNQQESELESNVSRLQEEYTQAKRHVDQLSTELSQSKIQSSQAKTQRLAAEKALQSYLDKSLQEETRQWSKFKTELSKIKN
jgi:chromosome segregation ATPase